MDDLTPNAVIAWNVRRLRRERGWTQAELAERTGLDPAAVLVTAGADDALDRLSPRQRAALLLRELEDLPFASVALQLGCSEATARVHHHRACRNLRKWLAEGDDLVFSSQAGGSTS